MILNQIKSFIIYIKSLIKVKNFFGKLIASFIMDFAVIQRKNNIDILLKELYLF